MPLNVTSFVIIMNINKANVFQVAVSGKLHQDPLYLILSEENGLNLEPLNLIPPAENCITNPTWTPLISFRLQKKLTPSADNSTNNST